MIPIESLLSGRMFVAPQLVGDRLYFISNLSGHLSLYAMDATGSVPEPLLPAHLALQNPHHIIGESYYVLPALGKILVMLDQHGDENYQPVFIPLEGGLPEPAFPTLTDVRVHCHRCYAAEGLAYLSTEAHKEAIMVAYQADLRTGTVRELMRSVYGAYFSGANADHTRVALLEGYTVGDHVLSEWSAATGAPRLVYGTPLDQRTPGQEVPLSSIQSSYYTPGDQGLLFFTALFSDTYGLGYLALAEGGDPQPVPISGLVHTGVGELVTINHLHDSRYSLEYNIDGASWLYEGTFDEAARTLHLDRVICGAGVLANGVLESNHYDAASDRYALAFSTAVSPTQLYTVGGAARDQITAHTRERILGVPQAWLAPGEDASFTSFDGLRISARLYRPAPALGFQGPRPLVYYVHGGPQGQERPDFAWFSMPLIQFLTLNGFAVFVPNVRGSTGYGLSYTKQVDRDWGGKDVQDHLCALEHLARDPGVDTGRAGVIGRSYGGYMTLMLAGRHPQHWAAAVDMFGPYDLLTFTERIPETWKAYFALAIGDPNKEEDRAFLIERSPRTYIHQITCPLLVLQGANDPRVIERESRDVVEHLQAQGKDVDYLVFTDEGHDVLKFANRVRCYTMITDFFTEHLQPGVAAVQ